MFINEFVHCDLHFNLCHNKGEIHEFHNKLNKIWAKGKLNIMNVEEQKVALSKQA